MQAATASGSVAHTPTVSPEMALPVVLDTNIVLDVLLFDDAAAAPLRAALAAGQLRWLATARMREELARVLLYPQIAPRLAYYGRTVAGLLEQVNVLAQQVEVAPRCQIVCKDVDDQCFIDLAVAHGALLLSKDSHVLRLRKRLVQHGVAVARTLPEALLARAQA